MRNYGVRTGFILLSCGALASSETLTAQEAREVSATAAAYTSGGSLRLPDGIDRWINVGASLGSDYNEEPFDSAAAGPIGVVQMEPAAYDYFRANRRYADGTMFLLTFYAVQPKPEPALQGFVQGDIAQREIHVIDRTRFPEEGRAFFLFPGEQPVGSRLPVGSPCFECHSQHGAFDATFVQFYPMLRDAVHSNTEPTLSD